MTRRSVVIFDVRCASEAPRSNPICSMTLAIKVFYRHYMQKEILEQPNAIKNYPDRAHQPWRSGSQRELGPNANEMLAQVEHIQIVAWWTSYNSGDGLPLLVRKRGRMSRDVEIASEFRYRKSGVAIA